MADSATFLVSNSLLGTLFSSENSLSIQLKKQILLILLSFIINDLNIKWTLQKLHSGPLRCVCSTTFQPLSSGKEKRGRVSSCLKRIRLLAGGVEWSISTVALEALAILFFNGCVRSQSVVPQTYCYFTSFFGGGGALPQGCRVKTSLLCIYSQRRHNISWSVH